MATHQTQSGYVELLGSWGHGRSPDKDYRRMPAVLTDDDGDGHYSAWKVTGSMRDAAAVVGRFLLRNDGLRIAIFTGSTVWAENTPDDFWLDAATGAPVTAETLDMRPNLAAYAECVAF